MTQVVFSECILDTLFVITNPISIKKFTRYRYMLVYQIMYKCDLYDEENYGENISFFPVITLLAVQCKVLNSKRIPLRF